MDCIGRRINYGITLPASFSLHSPMLCSQCTLAAPYSASQCMHMIFRIMPHRPMSADVCLPLRCVFTKFRNFHPVGDFVLTTRVESFPVSRRYCVLYSLSLIVIVLHSLSSVKLFSAQRTPFSGDNTVHWNTR